MKLIADLIDSVRGRDMPVKRVFLFLRCAFVESRGFGIASILRHDHLHRNIPDCGSLHEKNALELSELAFSDDPISGAVGLAAINSLTPVDYSRCRPLNAYEYIRARGRDSQVAVIGHFPFVERLRTEVKNLLVFEKYPNDGDINADLIPEYLPQCNVVGITATTLINHTLEDILACCDTRALKILMGPSTPMNPVLFSSGIDVLAGTAFADPEAAFSHLSQGGTFQKIPGARILAMEKKSF